MEEVKVVYALIKNKCNQILMVFNHEGYWSLPGGRVEVAESLEEAIMREVYEETGLNIKPGKVLAINECKFQKIKQHVIFFTFEACIVGGVEEIKMPEEILQLEWVDIKQVEARTPYYSEGIYELSQGKATYYNQGTEA
ncbi:NUDIX hydrolase [Longirhabdus pacifica]|uniref:NUDIX hydrolase n=1 Tax=Longirhabdus pacifica TaxID=2305227 RepID=UPI0010089271|nr:NUDIX hydrolase [Longirhabdus pacifica]